MDAFGGDAMVAYGLLPAQGGLFPILGFLGLFILLAVLSAAALSAQGSASRRLRGRLTKIRSRAAPQTKEGVAQLRRDLKDSSIPTLDRLIKRIIPPPAQLRRRLERTGRRISLGRYILLNLVLGVVGGFAVVTLFEAPPILGLLAAIVIGIGLPYVAIGWMAARRMTSFLKLFPDAIDLIVRGLKSGLPATESVTIVGQEVPDPVGTEFQRITDGMKLGQPLDVALAEAAARIPVTDFQFFVISLSVQKETGGNLTETLENLSTLLRRRQQTKLKIRAMSSEARASAYIIGSLPFIIGGIITLLNPEYTGTLFTDPRGHTMIGVGLTWLSIGAAVMAKMVRFEI